MRLCEWIKVHAEIRKTIPSKSKDQPFFKTPSLIYSLLYLNRNTVSSSLIERRVFSVFAQECIAGL